MERLFLAKPTRRERKLPSELKTEEEKAAGEPKK